MPRGAVRRIGSTRLRLSARVEAVAFAPDGKTVAGLDMYGWLGVWDRATGRPVWRRKTHRQVLGPALAFAPDGRTLFTGGAETAVGSYDSRTGKPGQSYPVFNRDGGLTRSPIYCVAPSPDGKMLAIGSWDYAIRLWDLVKGGEHPPLLGGDRCTHLLVFSPDSKTLASADSDKAVRLWDLASRKELRRLGRYRSEVRGLAFAPGGKSVAVGAEQLSLWDPGTGKRLASWGKAEGEVLALAFSPDGKLLASGHHNGQICLWEAGTRKLLRRLAGLGGVACPVAFSPDGKTLAAAAPGATVRL